MSSCDTASTTTTFLTHSDRIFVSSLLQEDHADVETNPRRTLLNAKEELQRVVQLACLKSRDGLPP